MKSKWCSVLGFKDIKGKPETVKPFELLRKDSLSSYCANVIVFLANVFLLSKINFPPRKSCTDAHDSAQPNLENTVFEFLEWP